MTVGQLIKRIPICNNNECTISAFPQINTYLILRRYHLYTSFLVNIYVLCGQYNDLFYSKMKMKKIPDCGLSEKFQNAIDKSYKENKSILLAHKYTAAHFLGLVQALK